MDKRILAAAGQINTTVGDIRGNCGKILEYAEKAVSEKADIISFPELSITGYPPEDLLLKPDFIRKNLDALSMLREKIKNVIAVVGFVDCEKNAIYNAAAVLFNGRTIAVYRKMLLPNYGVFDEKRYFAAGKDITVFNFSGVSFGISICEDIWHDEGPAGKQSAAGAKLLININGSPYHRGKTEEREQAVRRQCIRNGVAVCYTNLTGGQDELVFDGGSFIMDSAGKITHKAEPFKETLLIGEISLPVGKTAGTDKTISIPHKITDNRPPISKQKLRKISEEEDVYLALMTGLKDYVLKNGFKKAVLGLSGGIDSSIVAAIASDALGNENVTGVFMPSRYTSRESLEDAEQLAKNLGIKFLPIPIDGIFASCLETLSPAFSGSRPDTTEENLQARIRGNILMALSNKFGYMVLITGNKSEMSVGYSTLYGDMAGGFAVIKDVYKTLVYKLALWRNSHPYPSQFSLYPAGRGQGEGDTIIPERVLTKAPTAELRPNQKDQDTLPPYDILDGILKEYIEKDSSYTQIVSQGFPPDTVKKVMEMVDRSEYKRRQAPPGVKITPRAFGRDRRMPLTNRYRL